MSKPCCTTTGDPALTSCELPTGVGLTSVGVGSGAVFVVLVEGPPQATSATPIINSKMINIGKRRRTSVGILGDLPFLQYSIIMLMDRQPSIDGRERREM